jgi:N-acetylmuramoyl-L-alanine amidase
MIYPRRKATDLIVVHSTGTLGGAEKWARDIDRMHRLRGMNGIGFHYVIALDGTIQKGRPEDCIGAHTQGHNHNSVAVAYVGGVDLGGFAADTRTAAQKMALARLILELRERYPEARVAGQRDLPNTTGRADPFVWVKNSPGFDATAEFA